MDTNSLRVPINGVDVSRLMKPGIPDALIQAVAKLIEDEIAKHAPAPYCLNTVARQLATRFFVSFRIDDEDDEAQTYYREGRDAAWFEKLSDEDFAYRLMRASHDLADANIEAVECWIPIQAIVSLAADRIRKLIDAKAVATGEPVPERGVDTASETELRELYGWENDEPFPQTVEVCDGKWLRDGERYRFVTADETPERGLLARAQSFVDRTYVQQADARQKSLGLAYITAERSDLAREIAAFTERAQNERIAELEAALADSQKRVTALRAAYHVDGRS